MYKTISEVNPRNKNISVLFENLISEKIEMENKCFDCGCRSPELISINNAVLICKICGINHKSFPTGTSILINNNKNSLREKELKFLKFGGNKALYEFIQLICPNLINFPRKYLYTSPLLYYYRKRLNDLVENDNNYSKNKMEKFSDRLNYLEINYSNYKNNSSTGSTFINSTNYRPNTINYDAINNKNAELRNNKFKNYYKKENYEEESNNLLTENKIDSKKPFIVYNKPKLKNRFNKIKSFKKENNEESKSSRTEKKVIYSDDFDNIQKNKRNKNNNIGKDMPLNKYDDSSYTLTDDKYSSKTLIRSTKKNFNSHNNNCKQISNYQKTISNDSKKNKGEKRIKEIIINKNIHKDYSINKRQFCGQRMPIQVNVSLQNTIDSSRYNNTKLNNINYISDFNLNETPTIIIHNSNKEEKKEDNNSHSLKTTERKKKYNINSIEINFNKNKKMKYKEEKENKKMTRTISEKKIKTININFIKKTKKKILNNEKKEKQKEQLQKNKEKTIEPIKKENVEQFQILPIKIFNKIYPKRLNNTKLDINKNLLNKKIINKNRKMISPKRENNYNKSKSLIKNESTDYNSNHLSNSYKKIRTFKFEETFKNSIRNKYKREKIMQIK